MDKDKKKIIAGTAILGGAGLVYLLTRKAKEKPPVLQITLSNLAITPTTVFPGEAVTTSVLATNHSDSMLSTMINLRGDFTDSQPVTLEAGASETVTFILTPTIEKIYHVSVDSLSGSFVCTAAPHGDIILSNLVISPTSCIEGDTVTISVTATNQGNANEVMAITLNLTGSKYNDTWQDVHQIILEPGASQIVSFTYQPTVAETYVATVGSLSGSFVVNPAATWPGWTADTVVYGITVSPTVLYLGQTVNIVVDIEGPWPATYPMNIEATISIDGETLSNIFSIDFRNPGLVFTYTPTNVGEYIVRAQDKIATFTVLQDVVATYFSPFGGLRMPLCTDIVIPNVPPFILRHGTMGNIVFNWLGGDLKYSQIILATNKGQWPTRNPVSLFPFWAIEGLSMPQEVVSRLPYTEPITWNPPGASVTSWVISISRIDIISNIPTVLIMAVQYTCKEYWDSKDELAQMIARSKGPSLPSAWITQYGAKIDLGKGIRDWVFYPEIQSNCFQGYCDYWITCPYCGTKIGISHISSTDYILQNGAQSIARSLLEHIEATHPNHPLTEPAWF